jgi:5S rRNA maturation endonuclease (ribonuclease M5)
LSIIETLEADGHIFKKKTEREYATNCPKCGGVDRFCVWIDSEKFWCRQCNFKGDLIAYFQEIKKMTFEQAAIASGQEHKIKKTADVIPIPEKRHKKEDLGKIIATYDYCGTDGTLIYQVIRYEPKEFKQRRPGKVKEWVYDLAGVPRVLYRLPDIIDEGTVFFVEGEKDVETLRSHSFPATTIAGGSGSIDKSQKEHNILYPLTSKTVWIIPDNDPPGKEFAEKTAKYLSEIAKQVKIINLPVKPTGDVTDYLQNHIIEDLGKLVDAAPVYVAPYQSLSVERLLNTEYESKPPIISKGVLHEQDGLLIAGEGGVGKSMLRLELAIHLAMGWPWLDFFEIPRAKKVLIMQYENSERTEKIRLKMMMQGKGIERLPSGSLKWINRIRENRPDLTLKTGRDRLFEIIAEEKPEVVIYDCLSNLHSANENDNIKMRNVMDNFKDLDARFNTASIIIHHFGKPSSESNTPNRYRVRGATAITDWADCVFTYTIKAHENKVLRYFENTKMRNAQEIKPILLERNGNFLTTIVDEDTLCPPSRVVEILEHLGGEVTKAKDLLNAIMFETDCGERSAYAFIKQAEEKRVIIPFKTGRQKGYKLDV